MTLDPTILSNLVLVAAGFAAAFLVAMWLSLLIWTYRDIRRRARDPLMRILAVLVVAVLFLPGVVIYLILRPAHTLEEEYQRTLEEEALLQSIEDNPLCPGCGRRVREDWVACPNCHTRLKKACPQCAHPMDLAWNLCPYCGTPFPGVRAEPVNLDDPTGLAQADQPAPVPAADPS
ncbi:MAG TPA: zinc ribbon domain-containing protein [Anaerolineaceae bacterium]|nr:zinc ribbon domain-containing protein [Anaerolineaceae bacterium]